MQSTRFRYFFVLTLVVGFYLLGALYSQGIYAQTLVEQEKQWQSCEAAHYTGPREGRRNYTPQATLRSCTSKVARRQAA